MSKIQKRIRTLTGPVPIFLLSLIIAVFYLSVPVYATNNTINVTQFPELLGGAFNLSEEIAGLLLSAGVLLSIGLALAFLKAKGLILISVEIAALTVLVMLGWTPYFVMLVIVLLIALMYADKVRRAM